MNIFVPQLVKEQRKTNYSFLNYQGTKTVGICPGNFFLRITTNSNKCENWNNWKLRIWKFVNHKHLPKVSRLLVWFGFSRDFKDPYACIDFPNIFLVVLYLIYQCFVFWFVKKFTLLHVILSKTSFESIFVVYYASHCILTVMYKLSLLPLLLLHCYARWTGWQSSDYF